MAEAFLDMEQEMRQEIESLKKEVEELKMKLMNITGNVMTSYHSLSNAFNELDIKYINAQQAIYEKEVSKEKFMNLLQKLFELSMKS